MCCRDCQILVLTDAAHAHVKNGAAYVHTVYPMFLEYTTIRARVVYKCLYFTLCLFFLAIMTTAINLTLLGILVRVVELYCMSI